MIRFARRCFTLDLSGLTHYKPRFVAMDRTRTCLVELDRSVELK
jgi:hypothetical protein